MSDQLPGGRIKDIRVYRESFIGMALLACVPFLVFGAIEVYGWLIGIGMLLVWALVLFQGTRWFMPHPRWVFALGIVAIAMWGGVVLLTQ